METTQSIRPYFTVVTPALNCFQFLERNLASLRSQNLPASAIEHWIIDGGSTDGTVDFLKSQKNINWISEPDNGLSHAVNKGIERARGEWIIWLNADDELFPNALTSFLAEKKQYPDTKIFCGGQITFGYDGREETRIPGWDYNLDELLGTRTAINQASTFVHRDVYEKVGLLNVENRCAMDYEWTVKAMHQYRCQPIDAILTHYHRRPGSIMDANIAGQFREFRRIRRDYGLPRISRADARISFYLMTDPLRKVKSIRRLVRRIKSLFGAEPHHPLMGTNEK